MRNLLDTHVFLWAVGESPLLKPNVRRIIEEAESVHVSAASVWEIAIKVGLGKREADPHELAAAIEPSGFSELPVRASTVTSFSSSDPPMRRAPLQRERADTQATG
jgi:PIN domain nuclease of toxin-antitoxin system